MSDEELTQEPQESLPALNPIAAIQAGMVSDAAIPAAGAESPVHDLTPELELPRQAFQGSIYDERLYSRVQSALPDLREVLKKADEQVQYGQNLGLDLFRSLYFVEPQEQEVAKDYQPYSDAIKEARSTPEFAEVAAYTQLDGFNAGLAMGSFVEKLAEELAKQEEEQKKAEEAAEEGEEGDGQPAPGLGMGFGQAMRNAARQAAQAARATLQDQQAAEEAFSGGKDKLGQGWGAGTGAENLTGNMQARVKLAQKLKNNQRLRQIARLVGRMKAIADTAQKRKTTRPVSEVYSIETGRNLSRVISPELARLHQPQLRKVFMKDYLEGNLRQYALRSTEKVGKGPIVVAIDESGSMGGLPLDWAMAVFLVFLSLAAAQKRDLRVIHYGYGNELLVEDYPLGKGTPEQVIKTCLHNFGGGTEYEGWMKLSLEAIETSTYKRADVIHISDGICGLNEDFRKHFMEVKKEKDFRVQSIYIGTSYYGRYNAHTHEVDFLRTFSDDVTAIDTSKLEKEDGALLEQTFTV